MFDIGAGEIIFIVLVVLMLFGPKKLPEVARTINKGMAHARKAQRTFQDSVYNIKDEMNKSIRDAEKKIEKEISLENENNTEDIKNIKNKIDNSDNKNSK
jgi:sec-independent protein translocase protein TatA